MLTTMAASEEFVAISTPVSSKTVYDRNNIRCTDKTHTVCKLCKTLLKHNGNTSNMRTHLVRHHPSTGMDKRSKPPLSVKQDEREVVSQIKSESAIEAGDQATCRDLTRILKTGVRDSSKRKSRSPTIETQLQS